MAAKTKKTATKKKAAPKKVAVAKKSATTTTGSSSKTADMWLEYVAFLKKNVPAAFANLAPGATDKTIAQLEKTIGVTLPESVKAVWRLNDGQKETMLSDDTIYTTPCIPTMSFLSTKKVEYVWKHWKKLRDGMSAETLAKHDSYQKSAVPDVIKPRYTSPSLIPLWADPTRADYIGLDMDPGTQGQLGQIINFGRNENELFQFATDFDDLLAFLLSEIRTGNWKATVLEHDDDEETETPWFGPPEKNFYNTLLGRWKTRFEKPKAAPPPAAAPTPQGTARAQQRNAKILAFKGELEAAYQEIVKAVAVLSDDIPTLETFTEIAVKVGRFAEADERFIRLVQRVDNQPAARLSHLYGRVENLLQGLDNRALAKELLEARLAEYTADKHASIRKELRKMIAAIDSGAKSIL